MPDTCYKMVIFPLRVAVDAFYSASASGASLVEYRIGVRSEPPQWLYERGYGLFVFKTLGFLTNSLGWPLDRGVILECQCEEPMPIPILEIKPESLYKGVPLDEDIDPHLWHSGPVLWATGTLTYRYVTPVRQVVPHSRPKNRGSMH